MQTIGAQVGAAAFVIGSYYAAEWWRKRRPAQAPAPERAAASQAR